jgi:hypothetical protein
MLHYSFIIQSTKQGDKMKLNKRANIYKASNVSFNPETCEARSYEWWAFTKMVNGKLIFNNTSYSQSTCKHQSKVRALLRDLGLKIDLVVDARCGLQNDQWPAQAVESIETRINEVTSQLASSRRKKSLDASRIERLNELTLEKQVLVEFIATIN